jgi:NAD(P)-dependent dehydrogenase (short-subunit alcohol dehydrogenase family)
MTHAAGRSALVTGAGSGIGRAIALRLARAGHDVAVNDLVPDGAERTAGEVRALGGRGVALVADVGDAAAVRRMVADAAAALGGLDVLVNIAGLCRIGPVAELPEADWRETFRVDVDGVFFACQAALPHLVARGGGSIVNIASWNGKAGMPY